MDYQLFIKNIYHLHGEIKKKKLGQRKDKKELISCQLELLEDFNYEMRR